MLYHVSPIINHTSISLTGVEPAMARSKYKASWWVTSDKLAWALAHCSINHKCPVYDLEVWFIANRKLKRQTRTRWSGVFNTLCNNRPDGFLSAEEVLQELK